MAYLGFGNRIIKFGNNILNSGETFFFKFSGISFPEILSEEGSGMVQLKFSTPEKVVINYGDGVIIEYQSVYASPGVYEIMFRKKGINSLLTNINRYDYLDATVSSRVVSISFNRSKLIYFELFTLKLDVGDFLFEITKYPALKTFNIAQLFSVIGINLEGSILQSQLNEVIVNSAFNIASIYYSSIPDKLLQMPLKNLAIGSPGYTGGFAATKLDQIYRLAPTLEHFKIQNAPLTSLPSNFNLLTNLKRLELFSSQITTIPAEINTIMSLQNLHIGYNLFLANWGDISNLTNLNYLGLTNTPSLSNTLPSYFSVFLLLKTVDRRGSLKTTIDADAWVNNWYNLTVANSPISGSNTQQFRGMNHNITNQTLNDGVVAPSGIYQQPSGFLLGTSNGTPVTPKEKIWVMVNQYGHVWTTN